MDIQKKLSQLSDLDKAGKITGNFAQRGENIYSDATLQILSNNLVPKFQVLLLKMYFHIPYQLYTFDATDTDIEYFTAEVSFKYTIYTLSDMRGNPI